MRRQLLWLPAIALLAGCGGGGTNPPTTPPDDLPAVTRYPAYRAVSDEGNELFLQVREDAGTFDGVFTFFYKEEGSNTDIMEGKVEGTVEADGTIQMTLYNPYDEAEPPIEIVGHREGENLVMADVENPEDVETFEPMAPGEGLATRDGAQKDFRVQIEPILGVMGWQGVTVGVTVVPIWYIPVIWIGGASGSGELFVRGVNYNVSLLSWGNGWTKVQIGLQSGNDYRFEGWVNQNFHEVGSKEIEFHKDTLVRPYKDKLDPVAAKATLKPL